MRVFAWEYVTSGGLRKQAPPPSLVSEGAMMLRALLRDLAALPGIEAVAARDADIELGSLPTATRVVAEDDPWTVWSGLIDACAAVWPVAPETGGVLEQVTEMALRARRPVLNSRPRALAIARSKLATARHLAESGIPVVATRRLDEPIPDGPQGWVVKPWDGAGALDTHFFADQEDLTRWRDAASDAAHVIQPFLPGPALSLSMLAQDGAAWLLSCNVQHIACHKGRFALRGISVGGAEPRRPALQPLAERIAAALPDLWGYVGIDLIDTPQGPVVLEINPRLTTSYVGLSASLGLNPAGLVMSLLERPLSTLIRPLAPRAVEVEMPA